jgi:hypothetical protein
MTTRVASPAQVRPKDLLALCLFVGVTAIAGGLSLVVAPDGHLMRMSVELLERSVFASFLIPGVVLL